MIIIIIVIVIMIMIIIIIIIIMRLWVTSTTVTNYESAISGPGSQTDKCPDRRSQTECRSFQTPFGSPLSVSRTTTTVRHLLRACETSCSRSLDIRSIANLRVAVLIPLRRAQIRRGAQARRRGPRAFQPRGRTILD